MKTRINIVAVEDEVLSANRLRRLLAEILGDELSLRFFKTLASAEDHLAKNEIDLLLLDLNLNGEDGFEMLKKSVAGSFHTIVISANYERAIEAFEYGVLDFVAKPYTKDRLAKALDKTAANSDPGNKELLYLTIKRLGRLERINVNDISYIKAEGVYSQLVMLDGKEYLHDKNLDKLLGILPHRFSRVHRSYAVDLERVKALLKYEGSRYELELENGKVLPLGRTRYKELQKRFGVG